MIRFAPLLVCFALGCGPAQPTPPSPPEPIRAMNLLLSVRDWPDAFKRNYVGQRCAVRVPGHSWTVAGNELRYNTGLPKSEPAIVFHFPDAVALGNPADDLLVTGTCGGFVRDGRNRGDGIEFFVWFRECSLTRLPRP